MNSRSAFTVAAMAAALEETSVSFEDLADIEKDFDDVETEIIRQQVLLSAPIYAHRHETVSRIPNFWPLVFEQAPVEIDQYIQPSDSALLLSSLVSLQVRHFEIDPPPPPPPPSSSRTAKSSESESGDGVVASSRDPRSISFRWEFAPNEYFFDTVLEKRFWWRRARGWQGLVSEPVNIRWKKGRDLTAGLLDLVCKAWAAERRDEGADKAGSSETPERKALKEQIAVTALGGLSFFAWFGFIGRRVGSAESEAEGKRQKERRERRRRGEKVEENEDEEVDEDNNLEVEIFPDGEDLAIAISEELWPSAIKYFTQAMEQDALSDADFESDAEAPEEDEDDEDDVPTLAEVSTEDDEPPSKKRKDRE